MIFKAVVSSKAHPEYRQATIPFPIPDSEYDHTIELLDAMDIGSSTAQDCRVDGLDGGYPILNRLVAQCVNVDELDYLAKRLESFCSSEAAQFQAMASKLCLSDIKDFINLLGQQGHRMMTCEEGCIARTSQEFSHGYNTPRPGAAQNGDAVTRNGDVVNDFGYLLDLPGEERERRWLQERLETLSVREGIILAAAAQSDPPEDMAQAINQLQSLGYYEVRVGVDSYEALGQAYLRNETRTPQNALPFVDLAQTGRHYEDHHPGLFIGDCYVEYPQSAPQPVYHGQGTPLPEDDRWSVRLKIASPAVPVGVWMRLPSPSNWEDKTLQDEALALQALRVRHLDDCTLLDARCILPEAGDLMAQYDDAGDLIYDGQDLGYVLGEHGPSMEQYAAALELEHCRDLRFALDISQNMKCYDWVPCTNLAGYKAHLLEEQGYILTADEQGYIARNSREFHYSRSTPTPEQSGMMMQ